MTARDQIVAQLLDLPIEDRIHVRDILDESLQGEGAFGIDDQAAAAWTAEIDRRIAAYDRGEATAKPWEELRAELRQMLDQRRRSTTP